MTAAAHAPTTGPYVAALTTYTKAKWKGVLPLPAGAKWPPPDGHTGHNGIDPDGPTLVAWRNHHPNANIALRLPRGVIGVDVDDYGSKKGAQELAQLEERYGPLPPTWTSTSRGPGPSRIALYRCTDELVLPGKLAPAIEAIQHHHRYCVVWPSVVEGRLYRWYSPDGNVAERPPRLEELAELPDAWHRIQKPARPTPDAHYTPRAVEGDWSKAVSRYHAEGVQGLALPGGRHDSMLPVVMTLVRLDHDGHPGAAEALDDLRSRFVAAVSDRSGPSEALKEWDRMEAGAEAHVAVTPSLRGSYDDLRADYRERTLTDPEPPDRQPLADDGWDQPTPDDDDDEPVDEYDPDEWELVDLTEHVAGTFQRPQPTFLRRRT